MKPNTGFMFLWNADKTILRGWYSDLEVTQLCYSCFWKTYSRDCCFVCTECFPFQSSCRGQESGGIVTSTGAAGSRFTQKKGTGYISSIFHEEDLVKLKGNLGIGEFMVAFYY